MKKLNVIFLFLSSISFITIGVSCKTAPVVSSNLNPLELLDNQSSFYLRIPAATDEELISRIIQSSVDGVSEADSKKISERIEVVYVGLNRRRNETTYQISSLCNIPTFAISKVFTSRNGWDKDSFLLEDNSGKKINYNIFNNKSILASFPSEYVACLGRNVPTMIEKYHNLSCGINNVSFDNLDENVYSWLYYDDKNPDNVIKYYASKPQSFLTMLTGATLNFNLVYVRGIIKIDEKRDDQFIVQFEFEFKDTKFIPVAKGSLSVAFGLTDSDIALETPTHLVVNNIKISKKQLYNILIL